MNCQHQEPNCEHFRKFSTSEYNRWNRLRYYVTKYLMNDVSRSDFQILNQTKVDRKILFKHFTPEPESNEHAITQHGVEISYEWEKPVIGLSNKVLEMKDDNGQPLACWYAITFFHEIAPAAIHYDNDLSVKFENHGPPFQKKRDILKKQGIKPLYLKAAKKADKGERKCIYPRGCQICDKYNSELEGIRSVGRPLKRKGGRRSCGQ